MLDRRLTEALAELTAIKAARERIHASFTNAARTADGKCRCPYCRRDVDDLAELAATYEWERLAAVEALAALQREVADAMTVLDVNRPESGLRDACCQVKQAAVGAADNCEKLEAENRRLRAALAHRGEQNAEATRDPGGRRSAESAG